MDVKPRDARLSKATHVSKAQPRSDDGRRLAQVSPQTVARPDATPRERDHRAETAKKSSTAKAQAPGTNRGTTASKKRAIFESRKMADVRYIRIG